MDLDLKGRSVLISGASKGIGRAVAEEFAREGCSLFLVSRTAADLERARDEIRARHNVPVEIHAADLARPDARQAVVEKAGAIDILINNAGAIPKGDLLELDDARWREAWDLKVFGYINMCREFYRGMQARKSGVIINIIGFSSEKLDYDYLAGSTGNAGLVAFTRALGSMSIEYGVRVLGVNPGYVETERAVRGLRIRAAKGARRSREMARPRARSVAARQDDHSRRKSPTWWRFSRRTAQVPYAGRSSPSMRASRRAPTAAASASADSGVSECRATR